MKYFLEKLATLGAVLLYLAYIFGTLWGVIYFLPWLLAQILSQTNFVVAGLFIIIVVPAFPAIGEIFSGETNQPFWRRYLDHVANLGWRLASVVLAIAPAALYLVAIVAGGLTIIFLFGFPLYFAQQLGWHIGSALDPADLLVIGRLAGLTGAIALAAGVTNHLINKLIDRFADMLKLR